MKFLVVFKKYYTNVEVANDLNRNDYNEESGEVIIGMFEAETPTQAMIKAKEESDYSIEMMRTYLLDESITPADDLTCLDVMDNENNQALDKLKEYCDENNINADETVYRLCIEDVLCVLADNFREELAGGKFTVEDAIDVVKNKMEIDWMQYMEGCISARLL